MNTHNQPPLFDRVIKFITSFLLFAGLLSSVILAGIHYRDPWVRIKIFFLFHEERPEYKRMFLKKYHVIQNTDPYEKQPSFVDPYVKQPTPKKKIQTNEDDIKQIPKCRVSLALALIYQEPMEGNICTCHRFRSRYEYFCGIGMVDFGFTDPVLIPFSAVGCVVYILMFFLIRLRKKRVHSILFYFCFICYALIPALIVIHWYFLHSELPDLIYRMVYPSRYEFELIIIFSIVFLLMATFIIDLINAIIVRSCVNTLSKKKMNA